MNCQEKDNLAVTNCANRLMSFGADFDNVPKLFAGRLIRLTGRIVEDLSARKKRPVLELP